MCNNESCEIAICFAEANLMAAPALAAASTCSNTALKWAIISGLVGLLGTAGVLVGLHATGNLTPETTKGSQSALEGQPLESASNMINTALIAS
ncbi:golgin subfamily A member 6-like protein 2, partial [Biomphalaria glabrata]